MFGIRLDRFDHEVESASAVDLSGHNRAIFCSRTISTAWVESAINEIIAKRMAKNQQMRWNRWTVQPFLAVRIVALNDTLADSFRDWFPGFRPVDQKAPELLAA